MKLCPERGLTKMADRNRPDSKIHKMIARLCGVLLVVYMAFAIMPTTVYAQTISGNGYSFDTETGKLHIDNDAGTTAWREDQNIRKEEVLSVEFQRLDTPVLNIGDNAFADCTNLTGTIKINGRATSIGKTHSRDAKIWMRSGSRRAPAPISKRPASLTASLIWFMNIWIIRSILLLLRM